MTDMLTEQQAVAAAHATRAVLSELRHGPAATFGPLDPAARQTLKHLATDYLDTADAGYRLLHSLLPPALDTPGETAFPDIDAAQTWYRNNISDLIQIVKAAGNAELDDICWRLVVALEPLMTAFHDQPTWSEIAPYGLAAARRSGDAALARTLLTAGGGHRMGERTTAAIDAYTEAAGLYARLGDNKMALVTTNRLGIAHLAARHLDTAEQHFRQVITLTSDNPLLHGVAYGNTGAVYCRRGDFQSALSWGTSALDILESVSVEPTWRFTTHIDLAEAHTRHGDTDAAQRHLDQALALLPGAATRIGRISLGLITGLLQLAQHRYADAATTYQDVAWLQLAGTPLLQADTTEGMARAFAGLGQDEQAAELYDNALADRRRVGEPFATARNLAWYAATSARLGRDDQATAHRAEAMHLLSGLADPAVDQLHAELST